MHSKQAIISSLFWKFFERSGTQLIQFALSIVLARVLAPNDFGLVALITIFINIATVFVQSGLNTALIQKKDSDDLDFSTVFVASLGIAILVYTILFFSAPLISAFFNQETLTPVVRILSITLFIGVFNSIQNAYIAKHMMFKKLFFRSIGAVLISGSIGISLALAGFGVWALVYQQLSNILIAVIIMWFSIPWRPSFKFSATRIKSLFSFGWKLLCSSLLDVSFTNIRGLIIGKFFTPADLAYYNRGDTFPYIAISNINASISAVMLPALSSYQDDKIQLKRLMRRSIVTSTFIIAPMMAGLAAMAEPVVRIVLGDPWLPCVPFVQIYCIMYTFYPIHTSNLAAINAMGRSDIFLKLEIIKKIMGLTLLIGSYFYFKSPIGIAYGALTGSLICTFINVHPNKKLMGYGYIEQIKDIIPSFILSIFMGLAVYTLGFVQINIYLRIVLQIFAGIIFYFGFAKILHLERLEYLLQTIKEFWEKHG
jgi:O-antigen/teichoic acid export membrane protein